ncbi:MAG: DUF5666 domain-containing protein [Anaerolineae bacterium]|nr:DUF5666 domain-containing protein [Anaerolineae bacterium]
MFRKSHKQTFGLVVALFSILVVFFGQSIIYAQETTPTPTPTPDNRIELTGAIEAMDLDTITINGQVIDLSVAEINVALEVDAVVKVQGWLMEDGTILAREVNDLNDDNQNDNTPLDEVELVGMLSAYEDTTMTIAGQTIDVSSAEIEAGVKVGEIVKAHGTITDVAWVAREVKLAQEDDLSFDNNNDNNDDNSNDNSDDNGNDNAVVLPPNCVATQPAGWTTYAIRSGDTLSGIADRTDSSISELALANCIADPRFIVAGMTIFVPRQPSTSIDNNNDNNDDNGNDNGDDNGNDNSDDNGNDNDDDHGNDNGDDNGNDDGGSDDNGSDDD